MKEIEIKGVTLKIGGREIVLTVEEGKKLKEALNELFGKEVVHEHHHGWWWSYPQYSYTIPCVTSLGIVSDTTTLSAADLTNVAGITTTTAAGINCTLTDNTLNVTL